MQWLAGPAATFEEALSVGSDVRAAVVAAGPLLPCKDISRLYPSTMQDAVSVVHARLEENKKKAAASKQKSKSKPGAQHALSDAHFPGARAGGGEPSAFWMYIEVGRCSCILQAVYKCSTTGSASSSCCGWASARSQHRLARPAVARLSCPAPLPSPPSPLCL